MCGERPKRLSCSSFIPARAGNVPGVGGGTRWSSVHPRVCGERSKPLAKSLRSVHLRMRGEHVEHRLISFALHDVKQRHRRSLRSLQGSPSKIRCLFSYLPIAEVPGPKADGFRRTKRHQLESVEMQWNAPIDVAGVEVESRVVRFRPSDHGVAVFEGTGDVLPDHCPDFTQMNAHIFPPRGFRAPDREPIPRPRRRILNHDDQQPSGTTNTGPTASGPASDKERPPGESNPRYWECASRAGWSCGTYPGIRCVSPRGPPRSGLFAALPVISKAIGTTVSN